MQRDKRFFWGAIVVGVVCGAAAIGLSLLYNAAPEPNGFDRATFQTLFVSLLAAALVALLVVTWFMALKQDEVVRAADRVSVYWGWTIGAFIWLMTPWISSSLPEKLVAPLSNPDGDTLFTFSEATGAYMGGGLTLIVLVSVCSLVVKAGWWIAKR